MSEVPLYGVTALSGGDLRICMQRKTGTCDILPLYLAAYRCRGENNLRSFKNLRVENGSSQGQNLALTGLFIYAEISPER